MATLKQTKKENEIMKHDRWDYCANSVRITNIPTSNMKFGKDLAKKGKTNGKAK